MTGKFLKLQVTAIFAGVVFIFVMTATDFLAYHDSKASHIDSSAMSLNGVHHNKVKKLLPVFDDLLSSNQPDIPALVRSMFTKESFPPIFAPNLQLPSRSPPV